MIKLKQINITQPLNEVQAETLKNFISGDTHINGKIYVKKINRIFVNEKEMNIYKIELCRVVCINPVDVILIHEEV